MVSPCSCLGFIPLMLQTLNLFTFNISTIHQGRKLQALEHYTTLNNLDVLTLQETDINPLEFFRYQFFDNFNVENARGLATLIRKDIIVDQVIRPPGGRLLVTIFNDLHVINLYGWSGTQNVHQREAFF